jgi:hypothetical protein
MQARSRDYLARTKFSSVQTHSNETKA